MNNLNPFAISGIINTFVYFPLLIFLLLRGKSKISRIFSLHILCILIWSFASFLIGISKDPLFSLQVLKIAYPAVIFIPIFLEHSILILTKQKSRFLIFFVYTQGIIFTLFIFVGKFGNRIQLLFDSFYYYKGDHLFLLSFSGWVLIVSIAHYQLLRYYILQSDNRKRDLLFLILSFVGFIAGISNWFPTFGFEIYPYGNFIIPLHSLFATYAILNHQIVEIKVIVQKSIVYSILIILISLSYLIIILVFERLVQTYFGYQSIYNSIFIAFTLGIAFIPLKTKIQHIVDMFFFKKPRQRIIEEYELLQDEITRSDRLRSVATLASGIAHEIKNPLTAIKTFTEYLPDKYTNKEFVEKFSKIVGKEVDRIDELVHELLDFAKPSLLKIEATPVHKLIEDTVSYLSNDFIKHNITVNKRYVGGDEVKLNLDAKQITQALLNIYLNAIEAMPNGGTLTIITNIKESVFQIVINDTGTGIQKKDILRIFDPFFTKKDSGTGLGLSVTHGIIKQHGGSIKVESKKDNGARFIITLPLTSDFSI